MVEELQTYCRYSSLERASSKKASCNGTTKRQVYTSQGRTQKFKIGHPTCELEFIVVNRVKVDGSSRSRETFLHEELEREESKRNRSAERRRSSIRRLRLQCVHDYKDCSSTERTKLTVK